MCVWSLLGRSSRALFTRFPGQLPRLIQGALLLFFPLSFPFFFFPPFLFLRGFLKASLFPSSAKGKVTEMGPISKGVQALGKGWGTSNNQLPLGSQ